MRPLCDVRRHADGPRCGRPVSAKSALGQCEVHRRLALYRAWANGWPKAIPYAVTQQEDET